MPKEILRQLLRLAGALTSLVVGGRVGWLVIQEFLVALLRLFVATKSDPLEDLYN